MATLSYQAIVTMRYALYNLSLFLLQISSVIGTGRVVGGSAVTTNGGFAVNGLGGDSSGFGVKSEEDEGEGEVALSREELRSVKLRNQASVSFTMSVA